MSALLLVLTAGGCMDIAVGLCIDNCDGDFEDCLADEGIPTYLCESSSDECRDACIYHDP